MRKVLSLILSISLLATIFVTPAFAVSTYASAADMIEAVILTATSGVNSTSLSDAIITTKGKISISNDAVSFDGNVIGYWYSDSSNVLWSDSSKSSIVMQETASGYEALPSTLKTLLTDVNSQLTETYTPTTEDWSKIIGKYDITLGNWTIPKEQWYPLELSDDPLAEGKVINLSNITGISNLLSIANNTEDKVTIQAWLIDSAGNLYIQNAMTSVGRTGSQRMGSYMDTLQTMAQRDTDFDNAPAYNTAPYVKIGLSKYNSSDTVVYPRIYATDISNSVVATLAASQVTDESTRLYKVDDATVINTCNIADAKAYGIFYLRGSQLGTVYASNFTPWHNNHIAMFNSRSASKTVRGDSALTKRISKLSSVNAAEPLTIDDEGWYTTDGTSIDDFIGSQNVGNAGDTADINAVAEVEPMCFNVVVPTTLPVYVDASGVVSTATNATVTNKSNAAVKMTDINIVAKDSSGWTLVASNPSTVRDAMEFTFTTSLVKDTVLAKDEVLPFTYSTELSPLTEGADALDLATVQVTVDWAD